MAAASASRTFTAEFESRLSGASASHVDGQTPQVVHFSTAGHGRLESASRAFSCSVFRNSNERPESTIDHGRNSSYIAVARSVKCGVDARFAQGAVQIAPVRAAASITLLTVRSPDENRACSCAIAPT